MTARKFRCIADREVALNIRPVSDEVGQAWANAKGAMTMDVHGYINLDATNTDTAWLSLQDQLALAELLIANVREYHPVQVTYNEASTTKLLMEAS